MRGKAGNPQLGFVSALPLTGSPVGYMYFFNLRGPPFCNERHLATS